jgi:hypothetical protein
MDTPAASASPSRICSGSCLPRARGAVALRIPPHRGAAAPRIPPSRPSSLPLRPEGAPRRPLLLCRPLLLHAAELEARWRWGGPTWGQRSPLLDPPPPPPPPHKPRVEEEVGEGDVAATARTEGSISAHAATMLHGGRGEGGQICWPPPARRRALLPSSRKDEVSDATDGGPSSSSPGGGWRDSRSTGGGRACGDDDKE